MCGVEEVLLAPGIALEVVVDLSSAISYLFHTICNQELSVGVTLTHPFNFSDA